MQTLGIISVNMWSILISLCNLLLLFLILKKFLYKPVKNLLAAREAQVQAQYDAAAKAEADAEAARAEWEEKRQNAEAEAETIVKTATANAERRGNTIVAEAREKADRIVQQAQNEAVLEHKKAEAAIRQEIVDVSAVLATKMLEREVRAEDHRRMIDSFIKDMGDGE